MKTPVFVGFCFLAILALSQALPQYGLEHTEDERDLDNLEVMPKIQQLERAADERDIMEGDPGQDMTKRAALKNIAGGTANALRFISSIFKRDLSPEEDFETERSAEDRDITSDADLGTDVAKRGLKKTLLKYLLKKFKRDLSQEEDFETERSAEDRDITNDADLGTDVAKRGLKKKLLKYFLKHLKRERSAEDRDITSDADLGTDVTKRGWKRKYGLKALKMMSKLFKRDQTSENEDPKTGSKRFIPGGLIRTGTKYVANLLDRYANSRRALNEEDME